MLTKTLILLQQKLYKVCQYVGAVYIYSYALGVILLYHQREAESGWLGHKRLRDNYTLFT